MTIGLTAFDWRRISFPSTLLFNTASNSAAAVLKADQVEHQVSNKVDRVVQPVHLTHTQAVLSTLSTALIRCPLPYYLSLQCRRCWMSNYWFIAKFHCFWLIAPLSNACIAQSIEIGHRVEIVDSLIIIHHFYCYYYSLLFINCSAYWSWTQRRSVNSLFDNCDSGGIVITSHQWYFVFVQDIHLILKHTLWVYIRARWDWPRRPRFQN